MTLPDIVGLIGVAFYLIAYAGQQLGRFAKDDCRYIGLNILGPACLLYSLAFDFNLAAFLAQAVWLALTLPAAVKLVRASRRPGLTGRECVKNEG